MAGLLIHAVIGIVCGIVVFKFFRNVKYSCAIFFGIFLPDIMSTCYAAILVRSLDYHVILQSFAWKSFHEILNLQIIWMIPFVILYLVYFVYRGKKIKQINLTMFLILMILGFIVHIITDFFIIEKGILI